MIFHDILRIYFVKYFTEKFLEWFYNITQQDLFLRKIAKENLSKKHGRDFSDTLHALYHVILQKSSVKHFLKDWSNVITSDPPVLLCWLTSDFPVLMCSLTSDPPVLLCSPTREPPILLCLLTSDTPVLLYNPSSYLLPFQKIPVEINATISFPLKKSTWITM